MAKMNAKINKYIELGINIQYQANNTSESSYGSENIFMLLYENRGRQPIMQPEAENYKNPYNGDLQLNPIDLMKNGGEKTVKKESYIGKAQLTIKDFIKNLRINLSASRRAGYASQEKNMRTLTWYNYAGNVQRTANPANSLFKEKYSDYHDVLEATANYNFSLKTLTTSVCLQVLLTRTIVWTRWVVQQRICYPTISSPLIITILPLQPTAN